MPNGQLPVTKFSLPSSVHVVIPTTTLIGQGVWCWLGTQLWACQGGYCQSWCRIGKWCATTCRLPCTLDMYMCMHATCCTSCMHPEFLESTACILILFPSIFQRQLWSILRPTSTTMVGYTASVVGRLWLRPVIIRSMDLISFVCVFSHLPVWPGLGPCRSHAPAWMCGFAPPPGW